MSPSAISRIRRRIETLACTVCLATTVNAQRQHYPKNPLEHPAGDPFHDGILIRPIRFDKHDSLQQQKFVVYDFKPAFPPYTREALNDLLLLRDRHTVQVEGDGQETDRSGDQLQTNENVTQSEEIENIVSEDHETVDEATLTLEMTSDVVDAQHAVSQVHKDDAHVEKHASTDEEIQNLPNQQEVDDSAGDTQDERYDDVIQVETDRRAVPETESSSQPIAEEDVEQSYLQEALALSEEHLQQEFLDEKNEHIDDNNDCQPTEETLPDFTSTVTLDDIFTNSIHYIQSENEVELIEVVPEEPIRTSLDNADAIVTPLNLEVGPDEEHEHAAEQLAEIVDKTPSQENGGSTSTAEEEKPSTEQEVDQKEISSAIDENSPDGDSQEHPTQSLEDELILTSDKITIDYDESPPLANIQYKDEDANREFVTGLDEIDKLFESVSPPDELDVGADGSSIQDVLVGQGLKIIFKRAKSFGSSVKERFEKIVEKALPQQLMSLTSDHSDDGDEEESLEDIFKMLKGDIPTNGASDTEAGKIDDNVKSSNDDSHNALQNRFPLLKTKRANKIWKYARRKWEQAKHLFDEFFAIFEGHGEDDDDDEDIDFNSELGKMNYEEMRSLIQKSNLKRNEGSELPQFGMEVDDSFVRSRYDAMMKLREKNIQGLGGADNKKLE
ncbi:hypothetical protein ACHAW6_005675 [Cyclotella cf. meneghiniana]